MLQSPLNAASRRKLLPKVIVFVALVTVIWLQPKIQTWLEEHKPGSDVAVKDETAPSDTVPNFPGRKRVVIKDVDEPLTAEVDRVERAPTDSERRSSDDKISQKKETSVSPNRNAEEPEAKSDTELGKLREIRNNVFESTAGLRYVPGSADDHRLRHVMQHAKDDLTKPIHGVFDGDDDEILAVIDEAYQKAKNGGSEVRSEKQNDRRVYTVNLGRKIGYLGGSEGERKGNPACRYLRIVLEGENIVISAYPSKSF